MLSYLHACFGESFSWNRGGPPARTKQLACRKTHIPFPDSICAAQKIKLILNNSWGTRQIYAKVTMGEAWIGGIEKGRGV